MLKKLKLCPYSNSVNSVNPRLIKTKPYNVTYFEQYSETSNKVQVDVPQHVVFEWDFFNLILTDITYNILETYEINNILTCKIPGDEMKQYYIDTFDQSYQNMYKNRVKSGIYSLFKFREGFRYNSKEDIWYISLSSFLNNLEKEYQKDVILYGKYFDKPHLKEFDQDYY